MADESRNSFCMKIKASLHIHTAEDKAEGYIISYNVYDLIDEASKLGFSVLGLTCHESFVWREDYFNYAEERGILLISGIELYMRHYFLGNHVVILNIKPEEARVAEKIKTFDELADFRRKNPNIFILAPHPLYFRGESIGRKKLIKYIDLFDAIENSWFYTVKFNPNKEAEKIVQRFNKPFIATSDAHVLKYFNTDYAVVEAEKLEINSIFKAIREGNFINATKPKKFFELAWFLLIMNFKELIFLPLKFWRNRKVNKYGRLSKNWQSERS